MLKGNLISSWDTLLGLNQSEHARLPQELHSCENIIGERRGFSIWKGMDLFLDGGLGHPRYLYSTRWPEGNKTILVESESGIYVIQAGMVSKISQDLTRTTERRNPAHMTKFRNGQYILGTNYLRDAPWYWDGHIDRRAKELPVPVNFQVMIEFGGRLWAIGDPDNPLLAFYSERDDIEVKAGNFMPFTDNPLASKLVGCRAHTDRYAYFWGDRGLWLVEKTGNWPAFVGAIKVDDQCSCVSNNSISEIPGVGYAWEGTDGLYAVIGGRVRRIDVGNDPALTARIDGILAKRSMNDNCLASSFYYRARDLVVFSFPTKRCDSVLPYRDPYSIAWKVHANTLWPIGQGWQGVCEIDYTDQTRRLLGTDEDGKIYLIDYNIMQNKEGDALSWWGDLGWTETPGNEFKFSHAVLTRQIQGPQQIPVDFYHEYQSTPITSHFDITEKFDAAGSHPSFDPGGTADLGIPEAAVIDCQAPICLTGRRVKVRLHNDGGKVHGPERPMMSLKIFGTPLN